MEPSFKVTIHKDAKYAILTFDLPGEKVNKLTTAVMEEFQNHLDTLARNSELRLLVIRSAKPGIFIAGADISEIANITTPKEAQEKSGAGHAILNKLQQLPFPSLAVIDGACLGGGLELALACTFRAATDNPKTQMGLPEVNLGIIPGFGGTQRLPRLIGLPQALTMILTGKTLDGKKALRAHLVDALFAAEFIEERTEQLVHRLLQGISVQNQLIKRRRWGFMVWFLTKTFPGRILVLSQAHKSLVKKTHGHYPAPIAALSLIRATIGGSLNKGLRREVRVFGTLAPTAVSKNLIGIYHTSEQLKKDSGVIEPVNPVKVNGGGVLGAGTMGGGIAWLFSNRDIPVRIKDLNWDALALGYAAAAKVYKQLVKIRKYKPSQTIVKMHHISASVDYSGFESADVIIEAIVENMAIKKKALKELEEHVAPHTIIATNTSSLSITEMGSVLTRPQNFVGMHFFNPVNRMPLVEVIPGEQTSPETVSSIVALGRRFGKTPIVVGNCPGFLVNRILIPYLNEAALILQQGGLVQEIDHWILDFGMPMGPFTLADEVGLDVGYHVAKILEQGYGERMAVSHILYHMVELEKLLGKKGGIGFYQHKGKKHNVNPSMTRILSNVRELHSIKPISKHRDEVVDRCILIMVNEAARCIEEDIIASPAYLDMAMILGTGFPPFRGGLLRYADSRGITEINERLTYLSERFGKRFEPCGLITRKAKQKEGFYENH